MNDKKNFSALGKIDEKYVEEADVYAAPDSRSERPAANRERRRRLRRRLACRLAGIAVGAAVVCIACWYGAAPLFAAKKESGEASSFVTDQSYGVDGPLDGAGETAPPSDREDQSSSSDESCSGSGGCSEPLPAPDKN